MIFDDTLRTWITIQTKYFICIHIMQCLGSEKITVFPAPDPTLKGIPDPDPTLQVFPDPIPDAGKIYLFYQVKEKILLNHFECQTIGQQYCFH